MSESDADEKTLWWGMPITARRFHIFEGESALAKSLCGNWMYNWHDGVDEVTGEETYNEGNDCKACARKADVEGVDE